MAFLNPTLGLLLLLAGSQMSRAQVIDEYRVKAAFLYNFAKFVEWPASSFKNATDPIIICVLGNPFGDRLENTVNGKEIEGRRLIVRQISDISEAAGCHILFVATGKKRMADLLGSVKASPILTIGEAVNFAESGGVIGFKLESGKVRLQINIYAAERAHLLVSSKLLGLAEIVNEDAK
jgi:uncharacterized protein DUF4154